MIATTYCDCCLPEIPEGEHLVVRSDLKLKSAWAIQHGNNQKGTSKSASEGLKKKKKQTNK